MTWTRFMDMHSGGGMKESPYEYIYIEAPEEEACVIFYNRFGHDPDRVTCTCCGSDYSIDEEENLKEATAYERGCAFFPEEDRYVEMDEDLPVGVRVRGRFKHYCTLEDYIKLPHVLVIPKEEILPKERVGEIPDSGYMWMGD